MMSVLTLPIAPYGYGAVLFFAFVQSTGIPFPGAAVVVPIAAYAAATHDLSIALILALAALGGIGGSLCGFWLGKRYGARLLLRSGPHAGLTAHRLKRTRYLCDRYGRIAILVGCVLAQWIIPLAGIANRSWRHALPSLIAGPAIWALLFGLGGYVFGAGFHLVRGLAGVAITAAVLLGLVRLTVVLGRSVTDSDGRVEAAYPDPVSGPRRP